MKKILITLSLALAFVGCKKDNSTKTEPDQITIVGTWTFKTGRTQTFDANNKLISDVTETTNPDNYRFVYRADGSGSTYSGPSEAVFTYSLSGETLTELVDGITPIVYKTTLNSTTLTKHHEHVVSGNKTIEDEVFIKTSK